MMISLFIFTLDPCLVNSQIFRLLNCEILTYLVFCSISMTLLPLLAWDVVIFEF